MSLVSFVCVLSGRGLCDGPITCPVESYRVWFLCDLETLTRRKPRPRRAMGPREKESGGKLLFKIGKNVVLCWVFRESIQTVHRTLVFLAVLRGSDRYCPRA